MYVWNILENNCLWQSASESFSIYVTFKRFILTKFYSIAILTIFQYFKSGHVRNHCIRFIFQHHSPFLTTTCQYRICNLNWMVSTWWPLWCIEQVLGKKDRWVLQLKYYCKLYCSIIPNEYNWICCNSD